MKTTCDKCDGFNDNAGWTNYCTPCREKYLKTVKEHEEENKRRYKETLKD